MHDDHIRLFMRRRLKLESKPTMALVGFVVINGGYGIGECEEMFVGVLASIQSIFNELILVFEHFVDSAFADVAAVFFFAINGI